MRIETHGKISPELIIPESLLEIDIWKFIVLVYFFKGLKFSITKFLLLCFLV